ncbi:MAG: LytTR family DNA-binding domain-containing protein, partial [Cyclobacteriaceae bacterium]
ALSKISNVSVEVQKQQIRTVKQALSNEAETLILSLHDSFQLIDLKDLMYCESDKGYTTFYLSNGKKHLASKSLKEFEEQLTQHTFIRPHQSFIVNLKFIDKYDKSGTIHLKNGIKIPVSSRKKETFISHLLNWNKK